MVSGIPKCFRDSAGDLNRDLCKSAHDNVGNRVQAVETLRQPGAPTGDLFFDDGESGGSLWIAEGTWALADEAAYSGSFAWSDSPGADYLDGSNDSLTMAQPVELPASPATRLVFWDPIDLGAGDHATVQLSSDGGASWSVLLDQFEVVNAAWTEHTVDLSPYAGQSILIRFRLDARTDPQVGDGWHLDDVRITTAPQLPVAQVSDFVLLGKEGVYLKQNATVVSGDVGADVASDGPYLASGSEVTIGISVDLLDTTSRVMGDSLKLKDNAAVYDVYYNELDGLGDVLGNHHTPVLLPLVSEFPELPAFTPGTLDFDVPQGGAQTIDEGSYGLLKARKNSVITFTGGEYDFSEWDVGLTVDLFFEAPSEIRIAGRLAVDKNSALLPAAGSGLDATDIVIYVNGINGGTGKVGATPKAAKFGLATEVQANVYAPNGTVWLRQNGQFTGAFLGKWVTLGKGATATHQSQWTEGTGGTASALGGDASLASLTPGTSFATAVDPSSALAVAGDSSVSASVSIGDPSADAANPASTPLALSAADPLLALIAPFGLVAIVPFARRRRSQEFSIALVVLVIFAGVGLAFAAVAVPASSAEAMSLPTNGLDSIANTTPVSASGLASPPQQGGLETTYIDYTYDPLYRLTAADYDTGEFFHYNYDAVGNRLTQDALAGTNTYTYDIANRLTSVDGVPYTWDAKGNLLDDGTRSYTYDHASRLTSVVMGADSFSYAYNGLGDRLRQTVNGAPENYALDLAAGLTQVLQDGTNSYLYGVGRIGEEQAGGWAYHLLDAMGSARQLSLSSSEPVRSQSFEPFGDTLASDGAGVSAYGFTGEWEDATGLTYLRARYYLGDIGRFLSRDVWQHDYSKPMAHNGWQYAYSNPTNLTDPSGHDPYWCEEREEPDRTLCYQSYLGVDPRDLTDWLYREMITNAMDPQVRRLKTWTSIVEGGVGAGVIACGAGLYAGQWWLVAGGGIVVVGGVIFYYNLLDDFRQLVENGAPWDFKDEIGIELGPGVTLCASGNCQSDIEFSVPGNIHFAYIAGASGIMSIVTQAGAAWAEMNDPAHDTENVEEYVGEYVGPETLAQVFGPTWWDPSTWNLGDEPLDHEAVNLGISLWGDFGDSMTKGQFESRLSSNLSSIARWPPRARPVDPTTAIDWPYYVGYFNNIGRIYNLTKEQP